MLQDDSDSPEAHGSATSAEPLEAAARTALLRQLPPDLRPAAQAASAAAGGADVDAMQSTLEVRRVLWCLLLCASTECQPMPTAQSHHSYGNRA